MSAKIVTFSQTVRPPNHNGYAERTGANKSTHGLIGTMSQSRMYDADELEKKLAIIAKIFSR